MNLVEVKIDSFKEFGLISTKNITLIVVKKLQVTRDFEFKELLIGKGVYLISNKLMLFALASEYTWHYSFLDQSVSICIKVLKM